VFNLGYDLKQVERYPWVMELTGKQAAARKTHRRSGRKCRQDRSVSHSGAGPVEGDPLVDRFSWLSQSAAIHLSDWAH
jgi:hypothetical protein